MPSRELGLDAAVLAGLRAWLGVPEQVDDERLVNLLMETSVCVPVNKVRGLYFRLGVKVRQVDEDRLIELLDEEALHGVTGALHGVTGAAVGISQ